MTKALLKMIVACLVVTSLASGTAFAQGFFRSGRVLGYDTDVWRVWVPEGQVEVIVDAGTQTDVDLFVYKPGTRQPIVQDTDSTSYCVGDFYALHSGWIEIHVENLGRLPNAYILSVE